jgi:Tol biopolymer transport system component
MVDVYVAGLDLAAGKVGPAPARVAQRFIGSNRHPDWSPDGRQLAYVSRRSVLGVGPLGALLYIADVETGKRHEVPARFDRAMHPRWSPDGRSILLRATPSTREPGVYLVDPASGHSRLLVSGLPVRQAVWARDGKSIIMARHPEGTPAAGKPAQIISRDLETGTERELHREVAVGSPGDALLHDLDVSPDGRHLAFSASNGKDPKCLKVIPTAGGAARQVYCASTGITNFSGLSWSHDGKELIFVRASTPAARTQRELWAVAVAGGEPRKLSATMEGLQDPRLAPGGQRISYTAGSDSHEVWVMENFLPAR